MKIFTDVIDILNKIKEERKDMNTKENLQRNIEEMREQLRQMEEEVKQIEAERPKPYELFLEMGENGDLNFKYYEKEEDEYSTFFGWIDNRDSKIYLYKSIYEDWLNKGSKIASRAHNDFIEWKGGKYLINAIKTLVRVDTHHPVFIFNFNRSEPITACMDPNIERIKYSNIPIVRYFS